MKKIYIKETRNEKGAFYRSGDWGVERPDGWDNGKDNWTAVAPPAESLREANPIPCDWDETTQTWILDQKALDEKKTIEAKETLIDIDIKSIRSIREYISALPDAPQYLKEYEAQAQAERANIK